MGKTRGHGTRKGGAASGRSRGGRGGGRPAKDGAASDFESESSSSDSGNEKVMKVKKPGGQPSTAGMMPTDSDSEEEEQCQPQPPKPVAPPAPAPRAQPARKAAANGTSEEESSSGSEESSSGETESSSGESETDSDDDGPSAHRPPAFMDKGRKPPPPKAKPNASSEQVMPAAESEDTIQARKDMERLALIRQKREQQRLERVAKEGRDRFAAESKA